MSGRDGGCLSLGRPHNHRALLCFTLSLTFLEEAALPSRLALYGLELDCLHLNFGSIINQLFDLGRVI